MLDDIASVKATGLTFAPEAGTQRMRDVVNKNITEDDIYTTCHRVFSRGWSKIKLYFMIGLPTEEEADVLGIAKMGSEAREIGRQYHKRKVNVTVSVSSHVPKPHTPFQWCAQDSMEEIERKQALLRDEAKRRGFKLRMHDLRVSYLEGLIARGDARTGEWIERAWRGGARFDGWDEHLRWDVWMETLAEWERECGVSRDTFLGTLPIDGRLPWDHIDVGLAEGFLAKEYRRALKGRFSPPCGKPVEAKVHHTNLEDALADQRKLVCYHCGVACDMSGMRDERILFLDKMGAKDPPKARTEPNRKQTARERVERGLAPHDFEQGRPHRYRLRYGKTGPMSLRGHLDMIRVLPRVFRRAGLALYYTEGFSPRPQLTFGPALALGMHSLAEFVDFSLTRDVGEDRLLDALSRTSEEGLDFLEVRRLSESEPSLTKRIDAVEYQVSLPEGREDAYRERLDRFRAAPACPVTVTRKHKSRTVDAKSIVLSAELTSRATLTLQVVESSGKASLRPAEIVGTILGLDLPPQVFLRTLVLSQDGRDPMAVTGSSAELLGTSAS